MIRTRTRSFLAIMLQPYIKNDNIQLSFVRSCCFLILRFLLHQLPQALPLHLQHDKTQSGDYLRQARNEPSLDFLVLVGSLPRQFLTFPRKTALKETRILLDAMEAKAFCSLSCLKIYMVREIMHKRHGTVKFGVSTSMHELKSRSQTFPLREISCFS